MRSLVAACALLAACRPPCPPCPPPETPGPPERAPSSVCDREPSAEDLRAAAEDLHAVERLVDAHPVTGKDSAELRLARAAQSAGDYRACVDHDRLALAADDSAEVRLHLASCLERAGSVKAALHGLDELLATTPEHALAVRQRDRLRASMPKVRFEVAGQPPDQLTFDVTPAPTTFLGRTFSVDPGSHVVSAKSDADHSDFQRTFPAKVGCTTTVFVTLRPVQCTCIDPAMAACLAKAKTPKATRACAEQRAYCTRSCETR